MKVFTSGKFKALPRDQVATELSKWKISVDDWCFVIFTDITNELQRIQQLREETEANDEWDVLKTISERIGKLEQPITVKEFLFWHS